MGKDGTLTPSQTRAVGALLAERTVPAAAAAANVPVRTLYRWLSDDPAFAAALKVAEGELLNNAVRRLLAMQSSALDALQAVIDDAATPPAVRVSAARVIVDSLLRVREAVTFENRLAQLEGMLNGE
jgi:hypothetical protein